MPEYIDYRNELRITLIVGQGESGKTTFGFRYLLNAPGIACRFIFDDRGLAAERLRLKHCGTERECELALSTRWVCFNPHIMFPGAKLKDAFRWFCHWCFEVSKRGPGRKILYVDEIWQWMDALKIPVEFENCARTGRTHGLEVVATTHAPTDFHKDLRRMVTEWVCFNLQEKTDLDCIRQYFSGVDQVKGLPKGHFIAYNRQSGAELAGRLF